MRSVCGIKVGKKTVLHESAGGYLFSEDEGKVCVALLENNIGKYFIPKGHTKDNETPEQAALREIREELNLKEFPTMIAKVGVVKYSFNKPDDERKHIKNVHIYAYSLPNRAKIKPLKNEGYSAAKWFEVNEAFKKLEYEKETLLEADKLYRSYKVLLFYIEEIKNGLKDGLGRNLLAIVDAGSVSSGDYKPGWSDIDLLLVVKTLDLETKLKVGEIAGKLKANLNVELGLNIISEDEFLFPKFPETRLAGKTLQALLELSLNPKRLIFTDKIVEKVYVPNKKEIKAYSLSNIALLVLNNRRETTGILPKDEDKFKKVVEKQIRYSFVIMKLALQYFEGKVYETKAETLASARLYFNDYDFFRIQKVFDKTKEWEKIKGDKVLREVLEYSDNFIENFSKHVFNKVTLSS